MKPIEGIIYCIHCISTGEKYIGQTRKQLTERIRYHYYDSKKNNVRSKLYKQIQKTGWEDFIYGIVIECEVENLDNLECFYIEKYDSYYNGLNSVPGGGVFPIFSGDLHPMYQKHHTKESKKKISDNHYDVSGENNPNYGKTTSEKIKDKIRQKVLINCPHKGTHWWNNGVVEVRCKYSPGIEYIGGRLSKTIKKITENSSISICKGTYWWNNGKVEKRSHTIPDGNYIRGRLKLN